LASCAVFLAAFAATVLADPHTVINIADSGAGSLRRRFSMRTLCQTAAALI